MMTIKAKEYIDTLAARGETSFTAQNMRDQMGATAKSVERALYRLKRKGEIASLAKGYYLILTPEFRKLGCLPPDYFIDDLMRHWKQNYYVGLLSAALYFGAAHQQPQIFQVVTDQYRRDLTCGGVKIEFITKKNIPDIPVTQLKTHAGFMNVSAPETTMMDLCLFLRRSGGLSHVATILDELAESVEPSALKNLLEKNTETTWMQRLGYVLDQLDHQDLSNILYEHLKNQQTNIVALVPYYPMRGAERDAKWRIAINAVMESDVHDTD
ncbi:MAG TPA: type IV toxin-antitoxin system AbiEi family antitoxin [Gammaproteobacteria bacterium]|nr:type IV toxin-antitoxin system AbiEi family antitoxin [Gammaproteobacteria bacterium]